jgi:hypothetical protein
MELNIINFGQQCIWRATLIIVVVSIAVRDESQRLLQQQQRQRQQQQQGLLLQRGGQRDPRHVRWDQPCIPCRPVYVLLIRKLYGVKGNC